MRGGSWVRRLLGMFKKQQKGLDGWNGVRWRGDQEDSRARWQGPYKITGLYFVSNFVFKIEIKFTYNKMCRFQVFVLKGFGNYMCPITTTQSCMESSSITLESSLVTLPSRFSTSPEVTSVLICITVLEFHENGVMQYARSWVWFLSLSIMFWRFTHAVSCLYW